MRSPLSWRVRRPVAPVMTDDETQRAVLAVEATGSTVETRWTRCAAETGLPRRRVYNAALGRADAAA